MDAAAQQAVIAFLSDPASHGGGAVERVDTHISTVFLVGDRAFKLKKAVRLPFVDFTTPDSRRDACAAELTINRAAAPGLYLAVRTIAAGPDGRLCLDGPGPALDWVVEMRRFDPADQLDRLADTGPLDDSLLDRLTEAVVASHRAAPPRPDRGGSAALARIIDGNTQSMRPFRPAPLPDDAVTALADAAHAALDQVAPRLDRRRAAGFVRACHGDLHLGNLCLLDGRPTLFDAIEFNEDFSCIDVWYDLAFLLMDLDQRGHRPQASRVMNHYLDQTGDYDGVAALPLFLSVRAAVRAHVAAATAVGAIGADRDRQNTAARAYLDAARAYLAPPPPRLLAVGGLSGSGKSGLARRLAPLVGVPGAAVVRSDAVRKQLLGVAVTERLGPDGYTEAITERTYRAVETICADLLASGRPVIADAVFARPDQRAAIAAVAATAGVDFTGLWLDVPPERAADRIRSRRGNISDATPEVLARQLGYDTGPIDWHRIDSGGDKAATLAAARLCLNLGLA